MKNPSKPKTSDFTFLDCWVFVAGFACFLEFPYVGRIFGTDLILAVTLIFLLPGKIRQLDVRIVRSIIVLGIVWLLAQVATDFIRTSTPEDYLRGWAKIALTLVNFCALTLMLTGRRRFFLFAIGLSIGQIVKVFVNPDPYSAAEPWKFGLATPITVLLAVAATLAFRRGKPYISICALALGSVLNLVFNYRSMALFCFAALACTIYLTFSLWNRTGLNTKKALYFLAALLIFSFGFQKSYEYAAVNGILGQAALDKYNDQSGGDLGLLIGGRSESLVSLEAIAESPIIGHGSWARDSYYAGLLNTLNAQHGYRSSTTAGDDLIPSHSHVFGAWVEAGIFGAIFWIWIFCIALRGLIDALSSINGLNVITIFCGFLLLWDIPFSPFGADQRFVMPFYVLLLIFATKSRNKRPNQSRKTFMTSSSLRPISINSSPSGQRNLAGVTSQRYPAM
jgi:O-antigen ligase